MERGSSKGKRLIILHAITKDGPVGKRADLKWNKDMPHPMEYDKGDANFGTPFTNNESAELLWVASSNSGDYHDNMNSVSTSECLRTLIASSCSHEACV